MKKPEELTPKALERAYAAASVESGHICDEFIAAGRGHELPSQTRLLSDPLALRWKACAEKCAALGDEIRRRKEYSGTLRRIKTASA